jgi:hypothetical protein
MTAKRSKFDVAYLWLAAAACSVLLAAPAHAAKPAETTLDSRLYEIALSSSTPKAYQNRLKRLLKARENQRLRVLNIKQVSGGAGIGAAAAAASTDLNGDGVTNVTDVQLGIKQARGLSACTTGDVNKDGVCGVADVQLILGRALKGHKK